LLSILFEKVKKIKKIKKIKRGGDALFGSFLFIYFTFPFKNNAIGRHFIVCLDQPRVWGVMITLRY